MEKWDEVVIKTEFMRDMISGLINKALKKKAGCDVNVQLNELEVTDRDEKLHAHISIDAEIRMEELKELLKNNNII